MLIESLIEDWPGTGVVCRFDRPTGTWIFICLHDDTLGPFTGGTRMKAYPAPAEGLEDGMRLAEGMTHKWAAIGMEYGGGKAVLALQGALGAEARNGLLKRYGDLVESLGGRFRTGEDLGTTPDDMRLVAARTAFVHGVDPETGAKLDPSPFTARGVCSSIRAACGEVFGSEELSGRSVLVEGLGSVGWRLAELLRESGARVLAADIDAERSARAERELDASRIDVGEVPATACDVYAPCAVGATLNRESIPQLACRIVAGSANNQLAEPEDAGRLLERGIVYAPDYVVNGGGALSFGLMSRGERDHDMIARRVEEIGDMVRELLREAAASGESPVAAADRRVERALAAGRSR